MFLVNPLLDFLFNPWFTLSLIFWVVVFLLAYILRKKEGAVYIFFPLLAMFKTKKLNNFIKKISRKIPRFWKIFWTIGIFVSFGFTIFAIYFFFTNFINLIFNPKIEQAIVPLIPGVTIDLPMFFYIALPLLFIITTHEFAHGISASNEGVDVKSTGILGAGLFFIIGFGAFVEADERALNSNRFHRNTRLRIAASGTFVNGLTAGIGFILILSFPLMISPYYRQVPQVNTVLKEEEGGFNYGNLDRGNVILAIKKQNSGEETYLPLNEYQGISLSRILNNKTSLKCAIGDNLTFKIYVPSKDKYLEKNITLGPRYNIGIRYKYVSDGTELEIVKIYQEKEGGNNFDKNLTVGLKIDKINGIMINQSKGNTLEKILTSFNLESINLSSGTHTWILDVDTEGILIGIYSNSYFMHKNEYGKFLTSFFPEFLLREFIWLYIISFSITLFNMLPLPVFDGDRMVKELLNWGIGEQYKSKKKKKDVFRFDKNDNELELSEYRVENIEVVKILIEDQLRTTNKSEIILAKDKYDLIDRIGDGFKDTVSLKLPEQTKLEKNTIIEVSYEYWYDENKKLKRTIINLIRLITLFIVVANFILSYIKFGWLFFWI